MPQKGLEKAKETLDYLKMEDKERIEYNQYQTSLHDQASAYESTYVIGKIEGKKEGKIEGEKVGIKKGKIEGEKNKAYEIAMKSLQQGLDLETIKIITGLTDDEIVNLNS